DGEGRPQRAAVAHAAEERDLVLLEAHARAPAEAQPAPGQLGLDVLDRQGQTRGQALDDHDQGLAVRLTGGQEPKHPPIVLAPPNRSEACPRRSLATDGRMWRPVATKRWGAASRPVSAR